VTKDEFSATIKNGGKVTNQSPPGVWKATKKPMTSAVFEEHLTSSHGSAEDAFKAMDVDQNDCLTEEELVKGTASLKDPLTVQEAEYVFGGLDANADFQACRPEFLGTLKVGRFFQAPNALKAAGFEVGPAVQAAPPAEKQGASAAAASTPKPEALGLSGGGTPDKAAASTAAPAAAAPSTTVAAISTTVSLEAYELARKPIGLGDFAKRMGTKVPSEWHALEDSADGCIDLSTFKKATEGFHPPLTNEEANYAFCGMDENHDRQVCTFEFFGTLKIGHFFPSRSHLAHLKEVGALSERSQRGIPEIGSDDATTTTTVATTSAAPLATSGGGVPAQYMRVPAIVSGHAELTLRVAADSDGPTKPEQQELADIFKRAMQHQLGLDTNIADVESLHLNGVGDPRDKTVMILWTAGSVDDGGHLQSELQQHKEDIKHIIEREVNEKGFEWLEKDELWVRTSMNFFGPKAASLPKGSRVSEDIGHRVGADSPQN